jgi:hypothetical protein
MDPGFAVPFALAPKGALVPPTEATRRKHYRCPQCLGAVDLHAGARKRRHFHHRGGSVCAAETVTHKIAKALIVQAIVAWRRERHPPPRFVRRCAAPGCERESSQPTPAKVEGAVEELRLRSGRIADVALLGPVAVPIAAVEVRRSHEVDDAKAKEMGLPWVEVDAQQVCESAGHILVPLQDRFLPWLCAEHAPTRRARAREERDEPLRRNALLRRLGFRLEEFAGFRVEGLVRCPRGHDAFVFAWEGDRPPWPRPPLVVAHAADEDMAYGGVERRVRALLPWRRAYVSVCPSCGAVVGE